MFGGGRRLVCSPHHRSTRSLTTAATTTTTTTTMGTDDGEGPRRADRRRVRRLVCGLLVVSAAYSYWPSFLLPTGGLCNCATWSCVRRGTAALPVPPKFGFPHFYLGGGQKCGTTSLSHYIGEHPQVTAPWPKEPMVLNLHSLARTAATGWYIRQALHLPEVCEGGFETAAYDASANYLQKGNYTAEALRLINPEMKIVLIFREPLARAMSWLQHMAVKCVPPWPASPSPRHVRGARWTRTLLPLYPSTPGTRSSPTASTATP